MSIAKLKDYFNFWPVDSKKKLPTFLHSLEEEGLGVKTCWQQKWYENVSSASPDAKVRHGEAAASAKLVKLTELPHLRQYPQLQLKKES